MQTVSAIAELRHALAPLRGEATIGLVPTMGALHAGHRALLDTARAECDVVVASVFLNPAQFSDPADLAAYPADPASDERLAEAAGVDHLFAPPPAEFYPPGFATWVEPEGAALGLEGEARPGHFRGVATACLKLFTIVRPDVAYFGRKDAQQAVVIKRMVRDLDLPVEIEILPTVREDNGLALSSRNTYLSGEERERAAALNRALRAAEAAAADGESSVPALVEAALAELRSSGIEPEYVEARDAEDLSPLAELNGRPVVLAVAARVGRARLIDNVLITPSSTSQEREA